MNRRRLPKLLRPLLALLTVLASFMFVTREPGGTQAAVSASRLISTSQTVSAAQLRAMLARGPHCGDGQTSATHDQMAQHMTGHQHSPADHAAHCPFCLSNAFALEADIVGLPQGPPDSLAQPCLGAGFRVVATVRHADARAPPFEL